MHAQKDLEEIMDSGSTISLFKNKELVENIRESEIKLLMEQNGGNKSIKHVAVDGIMARSGFIQHPLQTYMVLRTR